MKKTISLLFVLTLLANLFSCQSRYYDSQLLAKAERLKKSNPDSALILLENIKTPENLNKKQYATYLLLTVEVKDKTAQDLSDETSLTTSIDYFTKAKLYEQAAYAHFYQNRIYQSQDQIELAIKHCCFAKDYAEKTTDLNLLGLIYHDLGNLYKEQFNFKDAIDNYKKGLGCFSKIKNNHYVGSMYKRIGDVFLLTTSIDSALINYHNSLEYAKKEKNQAEIYHTYQAISVSFYKAKLFQKAKIYIKNAIEMEYNSADTFNDYILLSEIYLSLNKLDSANLYLEKISFVDKELESNEKYLYKKMSYRINSMKEDYKSAMFDLRDCLEYQHLIYADAISQKLLEIQKKYDTEKLENEKNELIIQRLYFFFICLFVIFLIPFIVTFFIQKNKKHKSESLKKHQELLLLEEMLESKNEKENKLKELLIEKLEVTKKVALMKSRIDTNDNEFVKQYYKIFGENISDTLDWNNLYPIFDELYPNFISKLRQNFPSLTEKELQHCCLIKADFNSEEAGLFLSYEYSSVRVNKVRLRKKMGLETYKDFIEYISKL